MSSIEEDEPKKKRKKPELPIVSIKTTADYQRMKLQRLMANPDKPVTIPTKPKGKSLPPPPDFVRNIMGSSAGAGSGEFHVYRHLRRKEYARQKCMQEESRREELEAEFRQNVQQRQKIADDKMAKKRTKRLKRKAAKRRNKGKGPTNIQSSSSSSSEVDEANLMDDGSKNVEASIELKQISSVPEAESSSTTPIEECNSTLTPVYISSSSPMELLLPVSDQIPQELSK